MIIDDTLENLIHDSFLNYFTNQELPELATKFAGLHKLGYQFGYIESISGDIERWNIKSVSLPLKWFKQEKLDIAEILSNEKQAAINLQHFEYAARMRAFEVYFHKEMFNLNNPNLILKTIKTHLNYCVICKGQKIYLYLDSPLQQFLYKIKIVIASITKNTRVLNYAESIQEKIFKIDENKELAALVRSEYGQYWQTEFENRYAYMVYIDALQPIILSLKTDESEELICKPQISFVEHLSNINIWDLKLLTILVTHFSDLKITLMPYNGNQIPEIEALLADSGGWIVYPHHLENIFSMATGRNREDAIIFRSNINKKDINGYEPFLNTPICGITIGQLMQERMLTEFVLYPDYYTANLLYNFINN